MKTNSKAKKVNGTGQHIWTDIPEEHLTASGIPDGAKVEVISKNGKIVIRQEREPFFTRLFGRKLEEQND